MAYLDIQDIRNYVFAIFLGDDDGKVIAADSLTYLGTGFFISKKGDAVTARHVLPENIEDEIQHLYAILVIDGSVKFCRILKAVCNDDGDFALLQVQTEIEENSYFQVDFENPRLGTDVMAFGVADHEHYQKGKELRVLKGHVTLNPNLGFVEINFSIPSGMSGGPVLVGTKCVGFLQGNHKSEQLDERIEELIEVTDKKEKIHIIEHKQIISYGVFVPFAHFRGEKSEILHNEDLEEFINSRNKM